MDICIYFSYEVIISCQYCYIDECGDHQVENYTEVKVMEGGLLVDFITSKMKSPLFSSIFWGKKSIQISLLGPMDGTYEEFIILISKPILNR